MKHLVALITTIALATLFVLLVPSPAFAAVGAGGVWGGGVGSGYNTRNGWGWYRYNVSGAGITPSYFFSGTNWATVRNICAAEGDNYVIGFTLRNPDGLHAIHDDLGWGEAVLSNFLGNSGLPWMNRASALALYNTLPAAQKVGYTFGSNVGWFCYSDSNWTTTGSTTVNRATAAPGNTVVWTHTLRNNGPTATGVNVRSSTVGSGFGNAFDGEKNIVNAPMLSGQVRNPVSWQTYTVAPGDVGKTLCQQLRWTPTNSSGGVNGMTSRCVSVPYSYTLTPQVSAIPFDAVEPGTSYTVNSSIANSGPTRSRSSQWQLSYFTLSPGVAIPVGGISGATIPCTFFSTADSCSPAASGNGVFNPGSTPLPAHNSTVAFLPVGTRICHALSVRDYNGTVGSGWRNSSPRCVMLVKRPKAQIWGNDLRVGSGSTIAQANSAARVIGTVTSFPDGFYGTWSEYSILAPSQILGTASGSGIVANKVSAQSQWSRLTFANNGAYGQFATGASLGIFPAINTYLTDPSINLGSVPLDERVTNVTVNAFSTKVLSTTGTVTITSDIINDDGVDLPSEQQIPQMIIIANNINIQSNVSRVDAWLIAAGGTVNTCSDRSLPLVVGDCSNVLRVNGPVIARQLLLRRTGGANGGAAEILNLRSDAYLWAHNISKQNARWETTSTTELPPRY